MEPEQEALYTVFFKDREANYVNKLNPKLNLIAHHPGKRNHAEQHKHHQINPQ